MHDEQSNPEKEAINIDPNYREACLNLQYNFFLPLRSRKVIAKVTEIKRGTPCACDCEECEEAFLGLGIEEPK